MSIFRIWRDGWFSLLLLAAYVATFNAWLFLPRETVVLSGYGVGLILLGLLVYAGRRRYFLNFWDRFWHATVILDLVIEARVIPQHDHLGFLLCAGAFAVVIGGYRGWLFLRARSKVASLGFSSAGEPGVSGPHSGMTFHPGWEEEFKAVYRRGAEAWTSGRRSPSTMFSAADGAFLANLGCSTQELFDLVDDASVYGEPDLATTLELQRLRRGYFLDVQGGKSSGFRASMSDLPSKAASVDGIAWLPRLIVKARLKLRGEMPDDLMYGCGGDRPFVRRMKTTLPDFLRLVRDCGDDDRRIVDTLKGGAGLR
jgi:hypothetical protein